eukprot:TRINITY_DN1499_c0_g1_i5.p2 TRINITY_DN1499_c0_g1~~TRINITY_DN1499_c0_g1_i5.p2  ORF type:complete len:300 (-),score=41.79 TRINITY_DN1499_c0_g1_i5:228-1127(-)
MIAYSDTTEVSLISSYPPIEYCDAVPLTENIDGVLSGGQSSPSAYEASVSTDRHVTTESMNGLCLNLEAISKEMHPVDQIAREVEAEGIKQLLIMTKKKVLLKMCEQAQLDSTDIANDKRQLIVLLFHRWTTIGTKKFLKKHISDHHLSIIAKNLGLSDLHESPITSDSGALPTVTLTTASLGSNNLVGGGVSLGGIGKSLYFYDSASRRYCEEQIVRQLNMIGLEIFSRKITDENLRQTFLNQASKTKPPPRNNIVSSNNDDEYSTFKHVPRKKSPKYKKDKNTKSPRRENITTITKY